jgi:hypothetical protein
MAGYIGDNYVWKEQGSDGNWSFFVLSGTNRCPASKPWCGCVTSSRALHKSFVAQCTAALLTTHTQVRSRNAW